MCFLTMIIPYSTRSSLSVLYSSGTSAPATTADPPPWFLIALIVTTSTAQLGLSPAVQHLMLQNFSNPISDPNPASVITYPFSPTSFKASSSATIEEFPWAIFAKGPGWIKTGFDSNVCIKVGMIASFIKTVNAPPTPKSSAVTASPFLFKATTISPNQFLMSFKSFDKASTIMISLATEISKPVDLSNPLSSLPFPTVIPQSIQSLTSMTLFQLIVEGSISSHEYFTFYSSVHESGSWLNPSLSILFIMTSEMILFPSLFFGNNRLNKKLSLQVFSWNIQVSIAAANKLFAAVIAWISPVKWRLNSSMGIT